MGIAEVKEKWKECIAFFEKYEGSDFEEYSYEELKELSELLRVTPNLHLRSQLLPIVKEKRESLHPELLKPHYFVQLNEIPFLSEDVKFALDKHLAKYPVGSKLFDISRIVGTKLQDKTFNWLCENGIMQKEQAFSCPSCDDGYVTDFMPVEKLDELEKAWIHYKETKEDSDILDAFYIECTHAYHGGCDYEEHDLSEFELYQFMRITQYKMLQKPDRNWDKL